MIRPNRAAECFPLSEYVADELTERGWSVEDLCRGSAMPEHRVREMLEKGGEFRLSFREAEWLGCALGVSASLLLHLQLSYRKWKKAK